MKEKINPNIVGEEVLQLGAFTIVKLDDDTGKIGVGISKRSFYDKKNDSLGYTIAFGRAKKALILKLNKKRIVHSYMS